MIRTTVLYCVTTLPVTVLSVLLYIQYFAVLMRNSYCRLIDDKQRSTLSLKLCPGPVLWVKNGKGSFLGSIRKDDNRYLCLDNKGCDLFFIRFNKKGEIEEIEFTKESSSPFAVGKVMKVKKKSGRYFDAAIIDFVRSIDRKNVSELYLLQSLTISSLFLISNLYC